MMSYKEILANISLNSFWHGVVLDDTKEYLIIAFSDKKQPSDDTTEHLTKSPIDHQMIPLSI